MNIDTITNGYVLDHIEAGNSMKIYNHLGLDKLTCGVAVIQNVRSGKNGKKDIIKIDAIIDLDLDVLGYIDPGVTVNVVRDSVIVSKIHICLPEKLTDVIKCKNPRCITGVETQLPHIFRLTDEENKVYRCIYCDSVAKKK